ncbi:MAG TPA: ATP-binding protein [Anaerolineaceae bacterium]|jgi:anti-sigma regulatory factor (Ser/Thr protein kinase)
MRELALHILDIAENSIESDAGCVEITVVENSLDDRLTITIQDNGKGMDAAAVARVTDPFVTHRSTRKVGLGIPLLKFAAELANGSLSIHSELGKGTTLTVDFQRSHIDRMPLGDLASTFMTLVVSNSETHWMFHYQVDGAGFDFDNEPIKAELGDVSICEPAVLAYIRDSLYTGVSQAQSAIPG